MPAVKHSIAVVRGGLAGMVAALRFLERRCEVHLYEADIRLRGKAGADASGSGQEDHRYHIFPMWHVNVLKLVGEMDLAESLYLARRLVCGPRCESCRAG